MVLSLCATCLAAEFQIQESFVQHLKNSTNPTAVDKSKQVIACNFGLRPVSSSTNAPSNYFPYSTPEGRRIGFGLPVLNISEFFSGITPQEADLRLRNAITNAADALKTYIPVRYPGRFFDAGLELSGQEILVDFALSEGIENIPESLVEALYDGNIQAADWQEKIATQYLYIRKRDGLIQVLRNRAFAYRFSGTFHH